MNNSHLPNSERAIPIPAAEYLRESFDYLPETGELVWRERPLGHFKNLRGARSWNARFAGKAAGGVDNNGYICIKLGGIRYAAHRLIWKLHHGDIPHGKEIDHVNHVKTDNRLGNLRLSTRRENELHGCGRARRGSSSSYRGVSWDKGHGKWQARGRTDNGRKHLGYFTDEEEAARAYDAYVSEHHGEFASLNFPGASHEAVLCETPPKGPVG